MGGYVDGDTATKMKRRNRLRKIMSEYLHTPGTAEF